MNASAQANLAAQETLGGSTGFLIAIWEKAPFFIAAIVVMAIGIILSKIAHKSAKLAFSRISDRVEALNLIGRSAQFGTIGLAAATSLGIMGVNVGIIFAPIGFGIGFAMKDIIFNYMAGIIILIQEPFSRGDKIEVNGEMGIVDEIESTRVAIHTFTGQKVYITNADIFTKTIKNYSNLTTRRIDIKFSVDYGTDFERLREVAISIAKNTPNILANPEPALIVSGFGDYGANTELRAWIASDSSIIKIKSSLIEQLHDQLRIENINIPYPIRVIKTDSPKTTQTTIKKEKSAFNESPKGNRNIIYAKPEKKTESIPPKPKPETKNIVQNDENIFL